MKRGHVLLPLFLLCSLTASRAAAQDGGKNTAIRDLYTSMDKALYANRQTEALQYYHDIVSLGTAAASAVEDLVTSAPLSPKTYTAACSIWKEAGNRETGTRGLLYVLRSPGSGDIAKLKCLQVLNAWGDTTIDTDAENLFGDKGKNVNLRIVAGAVFRKLAPQRAEMKFLKTLEDGSEAMIIQYKAVQYLGNYGDPAVDEKLKSYILNGSRAADLSRERALVLFHARRGTGALGALNEVLQATTTPVSLKTRSIEILSAPAMLHGGGEAALDDFAKRTADPKLRGQALRALGRPVPVDTGESGNRKEENAPRARTGSPLRAD